jgi:hypothetical protein
MNPADHLTVVAHNEGVIDKLDADDGDWIMTLLFYTALHLVDAYMQPSLGACPSNHGERDDFMRRFGALRAARSRYRELRDYSRDARYAGFCFVVSGPEIVRAREHVSHFKGLVPSTPLAGG